MTASSFFVGSPRSVSNLVRQTAEVPDVGHRHNKLDMSCTLTAYFLLSNFNTATVADDTLVPDALVLSAGALIVLCRTEDTLAEQTVALWLVGTVVDGLRFRNLTIGVLKNLLRRCQSDGNLAEITLYFIISFESHIFFLSL